MARNIHTRVPEDFSTGTDPGDGIWAWLYAEGEMIPTGEANLTPGQAWEYDGDGDLVPTGDAITEDPYWQYDADGDLVPVTP